MTLRWPRYHQRNLVVGTITALFALLVLTPSSSVAAITVTGDAETGDFSQWCFQHSAVPQRIVTSPVREGRYAYRTEIQDGQLIYDSERSEIANGPKACGNDKYTEGEENYTAVSVYLDPSFPRYSVWSLVTQFKGPFTGTPPMQIALQNDRWSVLGNGRVSPRPRWDFGPVQRGIWNDFVLHAKWSPDPKVGWFEMYHQGKLVVPKTYTWTMYLDNGVATPLFLSVGQYRSVSNSGTAILYVDSVRVGSTLAEVSPGSGTPTTAPATTTTTAPATTTTTARATTTTTAPATTTTTAPATTTTTAPATTTTTAPAAGGIRTVGVSSAQNGTNSTELILPRPAGVAAGDLLVATLDVRGNPVITPPAGWMLIRSDDNGNSSFKATYYRFAGSAEPASWRFGLGTSMGASGGVLAYRGVHASAPVNAHGGKVNTTFSTSVVAPSITTTVPNTVLVFLAGTPGPSSATPPAGMTERFDVANATATYKVTSEGADQRFAPAGATGTRTALQANSFPSIGQLIALRPAS